MRTWADSDADFDPVMTSVVDRLRAAGCVFADDEARLLVAAAPTPSALESMVASRAAGRPLELVLGWAEFCGLRIVVEPGVFVPRRRTEFLVAQAVSVAPTRRRRRRHVLRIGCASVRLCSRCGRILHYTRLTWTLRLCCVRGEILARVVRCMRATCSMLFRRSCGGESMSSSRTFRTCRLDEFELMPPEARVHEPRVALDGGNDGLDLQRRVAAQAPQWLGARRPSADRDQRTSGGRFRSTFSGRTGSRRGWRRPRSWARRW